MIQLLKNLVCLGKQPYNNIPEEYNQHRMKFLTRYGVVFLEGKSSCIPTSVITLLHKIHPDMNRITLSAKRLR